MSPSIHFYVVNEETRRVSSWYPGMYGCLRHQQANTVRAASKSLRSSSKLFCVAEGLTTKPLYLAPWKRDGQKLITCTDNKRREVCRSAAEIGAVEAATEATEVDVEEAEVATSQTTALLIEC